MQQQSALSRRDLLGQIGACRFKSSAYLGLSQSSPWRGRAQTFTNDPKRGSSAAFDWCRSRVQECVGPR